MRFNLASREAKVTSIRIECEIPYVKSPFKYNTKRSIEPKDWDFKKV